MKTKKERVLITCRCGAVLCVSPINEIKDHKCPTEYYDNNSRTKKKMIVDPYAPRLG